MLALFAALAGISIGFTLGIMWETRRAERDATFWRSVFLEGARSQAELGFLVKKIASDSASATSSASSADGVRATPRLRRSHNPSNLGEEHPSGPIPPRPQDFVSEDTPRAFIQRLKTTPRE